MVERGRCPGPDHHIKRLRHAFARIMASETEAEELVLVEQRAAADADIKSPAREVVEYRQLRGEPHRIPQRHLDDGKADADALGAHGEGGGERNRVHVDALARKVVLGEPDAVEAQRLGKRGLLELPEDPLRNLREGEWASVIQPNFISTPPANSPSPC